VEGTCVSSTDNKSHSESAISARVVSPSGRNKETPSNFRSINVRTSFNALVQSTRIDEKMNKEEKCHTQRLKRLEESFDRLHLEQFHNAKGTAKPVDKKIQDENSESRTSSPLRASLKKEIPIERSASARHRNASPNSLLRTSPLRMAENLVMGIKGKKPAMR
jgi:predicted HNH restriction endonuclease